MISLLSNLSECFCGEYAFSHVYLAREWYSQFWIFNLYNVNSLFFQKNYHSIVVSLNINKQSWMNQRRSIVFRWRVFTTTRMSTLPLFGLLPVLFLALLGLFLLRLLFLFRGRPLRPLVRRGFLVWWNFLQGSWWKNNNCMTALLT